MKANKTYSLVIIILLLLTFIPLTIFGYVYKENNKEEENPSHNMYYNGKLWFYDKENNLINKYECQTSTCALAKSNMDQDKEYNINYYSEGTEENISVIEDKYAFIQDGDFINLYDIKANKVIQNYLTINNYNTVLSDYIYILQDKNKMYGVLYVGEMVNLVIPFEYDFIGLKRDIDDNNVLLINNYIAKKDDKWFLISNTNEKVTSDFEVVITDYSDKYIVSSVKDIDIYDYNNNKLNLDYKIDNYLFESGYIGIISNNVLYIYSSLSENYIKEINLTNTNNISLKYLDNELYIYQNNLLLDTYKK